MSDLILQEDDSRAAHKSHASPPPACTKCAHCTLEKPGAADQQTYGWWLALGAFALFVMPILLAIGGALLIGGGPATQFLGSLAGLAFGMCFPAFLWKKMHQLRQESS